MKIPAYAKFKNEFITKKRMRECEIIEVSHNYNAILTKILGAKKEDPDTCTILCTIWACQLCSVLCDLGSSIKLMPLDVFEQSRVNALAPTQLYGSWLIDQLKSQSEYFMIFL